MLSTVAVAFESGKEVVMHRRHVVKKGVKVLEFSRTWRGVEWWERN